MIIDTVDKLEKSYKSLETSEIIACDLEADGLDTKSAKIEGIGYGTKDLQYFIPFPYDAIDEQSMIEFLEKLFKKVVVFHNAKYDMKLLLHNHLPIPKVFHDTMIMSWLIDENTGHGLKSLAKEILGKNPKKWSELNRTLDLFTSPESVLEELAEYCCEDIKNTYELYEYFYPLLEKEGVKIDYEKIELNLIPVLIKMEMRGIKVDVNWLLQKQGEATTVLMNLEKKIQDKAKEYLPKNSAVLNTRSPKQLEELFFNYMRYDPVKRTEKGTKSTDNEVLETLVKKNKLKEDDIIPMLLKFRDLDKVNSTYLVALAEQAGLENVIHANFMQHGTRTGRLASSDPNLQNIPARHDEWNVRHCFMAREGYKFLMADYSQIELRMLAHFSRDETMINTFKKNGDIHAKTMELTHTERRAAKIINFGIVYGMGPRTLAQNLGIKEDDAKRFINRFFSGYPAVKYFNERVIQSTFRTGYVQMITGRKRHFQEIQDRRWYGTIARQCVNTKIQGSAADLIKVAMIRLQPEVEKLGAFPLVQIHDEIIIETPLDKVEETKAVVKNIMETSLKLRVPLIANIVEGERWIKG